LYGGFGERFLGVVRVSLEVFVKKPLGFVLKKVCRKVNGGRNLTN
jgi:hypothetical protein